MPEPQSSRRDFLRGRSVIEAASHTLSEAIDHLLPAEEPNPSSPERERTGHRVLVLARRAMACEFELRLNASSTENATEAGLAALDLVERLEDQLTVYREQSELIDLNRRAASEPVEVEQHLFELLLLADGLWKATDSALDLTSGPLSRVWGFSRREGKVPRKEDLEQALRLVGWDQVVLDQAAQTVHFQQEGIELNVNSLGKGYALDRAGAHLAEHGVEDSLMHGGRSTLLARGNNHALASGGWLAAVRDPLSPEREVARFTLRNEALSSSGNATQYFEHEHRRYGHLLDPRTGWPAEGVLLATVIAPTAAEADALSTAFCIMGLEATSQYCQTHPDVGALLQLAGNEETSTVHRLNLEER